MTQRYKVPKLLHTARQDDHFLDKLTISTEEENQLRELRKLIRATLKRGFKELRDRAHTFNNEAQQYIARLEPKFWTQGSFVYGTLNSPAYVPPQQIDLDDGVYFPMDVVEGNPKAAKDLLFTLVDGMLSNLARDRGWEFDNSKPTCARLNISERIHIDIPIYAIPEERYTVLKASMEMRKNEAIFESATDAEPVIWLDADQVYLAMRNKEHWKPSDPMDLQRWFDSECKLHTNRLRRVCRYLKAWRDHTWQKGGPSSITLMVAAAQTFDQHLNSAACGFDTDCQGLLAVARALPRQFAGRICNPEDAEEVMFPRGQSEEDLEQIRSQIQILQQKVESALCYAPSSEEVVSRLRNVFGGRLPSKPDWVEVVPIASAVRKVPARRQKRPEPPKSHRSA